MPRSWPEKVGSEKGGERGENYRPASIEYRAHCMQVHASGSGSGSINGSSGPDTTRTGFDDPEGGFWTMVAS